MARDSTASLRGRIGAYVLHSRYDSVDLTANARRKARETLEANLLADIDKREPGLREPERQRRLGHALSAHFRQMALKGANAKRAKAAQRRKGSGA